MKMFKKPMWTAMVFAIIALFACVTINIYFPAEKVESVAGDIVNDIRGKKPDQKGGQSKNDGAFLPEIRISLSLSSAWAQDVITVSNPTIRALKEGGNGYLSVANTGGLNLKEKRDLNGLVDAENSDRKTLYIEVAKALKIDPSQIDRIAGIFAKEWQKPVR
jgi:hypothetical protein